MMPDSQYNFTPVTTTEWFNRLPLFATVTRTCPVLFTRACILLGTLLLTIVVLFRFFTQYNDMDFGQFYMGGAVARAGAWKALYPTPVPGSSYNVGENEASTMRPEYAALAFQTEVGDTKRFMQPPPNALLYFPFAFLKYRTAHLVWTFLSIAFATAIAFQAAQILSGLRGGPSHLGGFLAFAVVTSPTMYQAVRMGQVSTLIGALIGAAILGLLNTPRPRDAGAIVLATLTKYAAVVLLPIIIAMRRWRTLAWISLFAGAVIIISIAVMGIDPWRIWLTQVVPTLGRSHDWSANQSFAGLFIRLTGRFPLSSTLTSLVNAASLITLVSLVAFILTRPRTFWLMPANTLAACAAMLCWLQFFSPIFWTNYYPYFFPLWGWLAWEAHRSRLAAAGALAAMALAWVPLSVATVILPLPLAFHLLISSVIVSLFSLNRVLNPYPLPSVSSAGHSAWISPPHPVSPDNTVVLPSTSSNQSR